MRRSAYFYKYRTPEVATIILATGRLRWSSPIDFNDPFDCYFAPRLVDLPRGIVEYERRHHAILTGEEILSPKTPAAFSFAPLINLLPKVPPNVVARSRKATKALLRSIAEHANQQWQLWWETQMRRFRVLCLCEDGNNPLLWSHYADQHRGVVFEFHASPKTRTPFQKAEPVKYQKRPPHVYSRQDLVNSALGLKALAEDENAFLPLVMTKATEWRYEKEWRIVKAGIDDGQHSFEDTAFSPNSLSRIFLGCRISPRSKRTIMRLAGGKFAHAEIHEAYQTLDRFGLGSRRIR